MYHFERESLVIGGENRSKPFLAYGAIKLDVTQLISIPCAKFSSRFKVNGLGIRGGKDASVSLSQIKKRNLPQTQKLTFKVLLPKKTWEEEWEYLKQ